MPDSSSERSTRLDSELTIVTLLSHHCVNDLDEYGDDPPGEVRQKRGDHLQEANVGKQYVGMVLEVFNHDVGRDWT